MKQERPEQRTQPYWKATHELGAWRDDETGLREAGLPGQLRQLNQFDTDNPGALERSRLLRLLGSINYRILKGTRIYVEVGGVVYKTLYGGYWRSVFTGVEHYLLRCEEVSGFIWTEGSADVDMIDLSIAHTKDGWTAKGHSLMFMLNRD